MRVYMYITDLTESYGCLLDFNQFFNKHNFIPSKSNLLPETLWYTNTYNHN